MDSRPILKNTKEIRVYIDSKTFDDLLNENDRLAFAILRYYNSDGLKFVRSPLKTEYTELKDVVEYELELDSNSEIESIKIPPGEVWGFGYRKNDIKSIAQHIYQKHEISNNELDTITSVFIQAGFNIQVKSNLYITNEKILLKNRLWFEAHFPGSTLNMMSVKEACIFLDLFFKVNGKYCASSRFYLNKGRWYWFSMRLKIPNFNVGDKMMDALADRLYFSLMVLDEMGIQYYLGANNDTMNNTLYHFSYLITLITGIFDNLALKTNTFLGINFQDFRKVSLSKKSGREFLKEIRNKNSTIRDHINSYVHLIKLIYLFRELVIHREGLSKSGYEYKGNDIRWKANFIKIPPEISEQIKENLKQCGDVKSDFDPFSKWGLYEASPFFLFLEPYHFSISAITMLIEFIDKYLALFGYSSFIENQKQREDEFTRTLKVFEKYHLGF